MKRVMPEPSWPASWHYSYKYDLLELWGDDASPGYTYAYRNRTTTALELVASVALAHPMRSWPKPPPWWLRAATSW